MWKTLGWGLLFRAEAAVESAWETKCPEQREGILTIASSCLYSSILSCNSLKLSSMLRECLATAASRLVNAPSMSVSWTNTMPELGPSVLLARSQMSLRETG